MNQCLFSLLSCCGETGLLRSHIHEWGSCTWKPGEVESTWMDRLLSPALGTLAFLWHKFPWKRCLSLVLEFEPWKLNLQAQTRHFWWNKQIHNVITKIISSWNHISQDSESCWWANTQTRWEPFSWRALIQRVDQTVDRQTQGCDLIFKGPLQTLLICRPKRLIRQGSDAQSCKRSGSSATSRIPHTHLVRLKPELITSVNCVHHDSYPTDASLPPCHCGK